VPAFRLALLPLLAALLAGCQPQPIDRPDETATGQRPADDWPLFDYARASAAGQTVYRLDADRSRVDVVVRRAGPLARFGHDHVISLREAHGFLLLGEGGQAARAELRFPVASLAIDGASERARYQLDTEPDASAIEGTRSNLMQHVLDAQNWPFATIEVREFARQNEQVTALVTIGINGSSYSGRHVFELRASPDNASVEGSMMLRQTSLGLQPFSALGGGLRVADEMEIHYRLTGSPQ
jgi:hypothetical protein